MTVFGMGRSGQSAADLLLDRGSNVTLFEEHPGPEIKALRANYEQRGASLCFGDNLEPVLRSAELLVVSPGVPEDHPVLQTGSPTGYPGHWRN